LKGWPPSEVQQRGNHVSWTGRVRNTLSLSLVILLARFDWCGVRYRARQHLKGILGSRYRVFRISTKSHFIRSWFAATWMWGIVIPSFICVLLYVIGIVPDSFNVSNDVLTQSLAIFLPVPLALVGLIIPFLALAVSVVYSRMGSGAVAYAMKQNRVTRLVYSALVILGLLVLTQLFLKISDTVLGNDLAAEVISSAGWVFALMNTWWVIYLIILAGIGVTSVLAVFSPARALRAINKDVVLESMRTLKREFEENLSLKALEVSLKDSNLEVGFFPPSDGELITTKQVGTITNVSCWGLRKINAVLTPKPNSFVKIILARPHHYIASHDSQLAGIRGDISDSIPRALLKRAVRSCYKVQKLNVEKDKLYQALEHYKEITNSFLRGDNEDFVRVALDGYGSVLKSYMALELKLSAKDSPGLLGDWRPIMLIMDALNNSIATTVGTSESKNVSMVAHWIKVLMQECIEKQEEYLFSRLLNLYRSMYLYASKSHNTIGIHRSHFEPMQLLDYDIFRFGKTEAVPHDKVAFRCRLASLIVHHLARLLRDSLDANDPKNVEEMLLHLQPEELYGHFHPDLPFDCFEVESRLRLGQFDDSERGLLEDQQKSGQLLEQFEKESLQWHVDILHNSLMYLIDKTAHKAVKIDSVATVINKIWNRFPNWSATVDWLERYNVGRQIFDERLWEYWPESRRVQSKSPMAAPILVFTIRGLYLQSQTQNPVDIPGLRTIDGFHDHIVEVARSIHSGSDWRELTGIIDSGTLTLFEQALASGRKKYKDDVATAVKASTLSVGKIAEFRKKTMDSYNGASVLRYIVSESAIDEATESELLEQLTISIPHNRYPKEAFIDQDRISYFDFGDNEGRALGQGIDENIWMTIKDRIPDQRSITFTQDYIVSLDNAIAQIDADLHSSLVIIFSGASQMRFNLWSARKFTPAIQLGKAEQKGFYGEYDGIPVYTAFNSAIDGVMLFIKNDVIFEELKGPVVDVREFTVEERKDLAIRAKVSAEKLGEEVFVEAYVTYKLRVSSNFQTIILSVSPD